MPPYLQNSQQASNRRKIWCLRPLPRLILQGSEKRHISRL